MIKKGTWVLIKKVVLNPENRAPNIPDDTKKHPLMMWVKGYLLTDANINDEVKIITLTGREENGILIEEKPYYKHHFGTFVQSLEDMKQVILKDMEDIS